MIAVHQMADTSTVVRFGAFRFCPQTGELERQGRRVKLQPQPAKLLAVLLSRPDELVTREELRQQLWADDTFVDFDQGLNFSIRQVRTALGDDAETPRFIETLPRRGYRFVAPVQVDVGQPVTPAAAAPPEPIVDPPPPLSAVVETATSWKRVLVAGVLVVVGAGGGYAVRDRVSSVPASSALVFDVPVMPSVALDEHSIPSVSPDATKVVFAGNGGSGERSLWLTEFSTGTARGLEHTAGARFPFWSPDGRSIGFFADQKLKVFDVETAAVRVVCDVNRPAGGSWGPGGVTHSPTMAKVRLRSPRTGGRQPR